MTSHSSLVAGNSFCVDSLRPPVPGCGGIIGNKLTTDGKSAIVSELSHSQSVPLSTSLTATSPASCKPALLQEPDGCTSNIELCPEVCEPGLSKMDSLVSLLNDHHGIAFFRQFLTTKHACDVLEFWLACMGYRKSDAVRCSSIATVIYKKFIAPVSNRVHLSGTTRRAIKERLKSGNVDRTLFDSAAREVETFLLRHHYPLFLESDNYAEYIQTRSANHSPLSDSNSDDSGMQKQLRTAETFNHQECNKERFCKDDTSAAKMPEDWKNQTPVKFRCTDDCLAQPGLVLFSFICTAFFQYICQCVLSFYLYRKSFQWPCQSTYRMPDSMHLQQPRRKM